MTLLADSFRFKCPECGALAATPCVYMADGFKTSFDWATHRTTRTQTRAKGQPTKRPHNGRIAKAAHAQQAKELAEWRAEQALKLRDPYAEARRAYTLFGKLEQEQLVAWLRRFGSVLWTT